MVKILLHGDVLLFNDMFNGSCFVHFICTSYYYILHPATHANRGAMTGELCIAVWLLHKRELWAGKSQERLGALHKVLHNVLHKVLHNVLHNVLHCTMFCTMCFWPTIQCHEVQNYIRYNFALFEFCTKRGREKVKYFAQCTPSCCLHCALCNSVKVNTVLREERGGQSKERVEDQDLQLVTGWVIIVSSRGILVKLVTDVTGGHWKPKILSSWKNGILGYIWHSLNASN